jgi:cytoskeleton protein RodZ
LSKRKWPFAEAKPDLPAGEAVEDETELPLPVPSGPSVGQQLRAAREAASLDIQEVARTLKFSVRQIELLEADDYDALPGNTIVRGFVRSYGRFLKLDVEPLVHMLDERTPSITADVRPPENMGTAKQPWESPQVPLLAALLLALVILAAVASALWHFYGPALTKSRDALLSPAALPQAPPVVAEPVETPMILPPRDAAVFPAEAGPSATPGLAPVMPPVEIPPPRLVFVFSDRSWIEVTDGTRKIIHSGEHLAGSQLKLDGVPPFDLVVGNPTKVKLAYGERSIDLAPHTRADVARLKVEQ